MWKSFAWGECGEICWGVGEVRREVGKGIRGVREGRERCGGFKEVWGR